MHDERNENWESALRYFAAHILGKKFETVQAAGIGALVGEALEKIGATLVNDDEEQAVPYPKSHPETSAENLT